MAVFHVSVFADQDAFRSAIKKNFQESEVFALPANQYLISAPLTAQQLSKKLPESTHLVYTVSSYFGRFSPEVWEWLKLKMESHATS